jgi:rhodanese-related sulfurtransferase
MLRKVLPFLTVLFVLLALIAFWSSPLVAEEVEKGKIPAGHLKKSFKSLPWKSPIWDIDEAITHLKAKDKILWVDTRPEAFFKKGSIQGAVLLPFNKTGGNGNVLTQEKLESAIKDAGMSKDTAKIVFFCQGPKCHRSYNATHIVVTKWGFNPQNIIWFRDGYPTLFNKVKVDPKLKRQAKTYISDEGIKLM